MSIPRVLFAFMAVSLPACHLVDQRDFNPQAGLPPAKPVVAVPSAPAKPALVTIRYMEPNPPYREALTAAVHAALARKPDVQFIVSTVAPQAETADEAADLGARAAASGREVAQTIVDAGAAPAQVEQLVNVDPSARYREVVVQVQ
jgi:hypothetical protein